MLIISGFLVNFFDTFVLSNCPYLRRIRGGLLKGNGSFFPCVKNKIQCTIYSVASHALVYNLHDTTTELTK